MSIENSSVLGHKPGLFVLFFTEMWERFSYYGMRALLVLFLTSSLMDSGYGWERKDALQLYALYTGLVYFTPLIGGFLADKYLGFKKAVIIGAFIMALGHGLMALEIPTFFYLGLLAVIIGNGMFKPNISSMVGQLYKDDEEKKDSAYTIFYMGINAGSFLGILMCGYLGEKVGWSYGFGLAMIFMIAGALQFWYSDSIFGEIGNKPSTQKKESITTEITQSGDQNNNRRTKWTIIGLAIGALVYFLSSGNNTISELPMVNVINVINIWIPPVIFGCVIAIIGYIVTDPTLTKIEKDRVWVIIILTFFTVFFWWAFEQAGGSMTIFSKDYTDRSLSGNGALFFNLTNAVLTLGALGVITWVLFKLFKTTFLQVRLANSILGFSFIIVWGIVLWMLWREFQAENTEVQASWFSILNSFFIISMAPLVSKFWNMKIVTSGAIKFAIGLVLVGIGFAFLSWGSNGIEQGATTASVSMIWLVLAYYFHSMGELCVSPVGLSYVSKLAPARLVGLMFGVWFIANFIANWSAGITGSFIDKISEAYSISTFFLIFTFIPIGAGLVLFLLNPMMKRMMHGYE